MESTTLNQWIILIALLAPSESRGEERIVTAKDREHWSFKPLRAVEVPAVRSSHPARNPIDHFILAKLEEKGLDLSPPADPRTLARRLHFDLIGLPPAPEAVDSFAREISSAAPRGSTTTGQVVIADLVDRLLASRHHGVRWARHWLDVARYADSSGQEGDEDRPNAYHYRDFVIRAMNDDLPYDTFVRWQLAGDEYEPENPAAVSATGFLVAGPSTMLADTFLEDERLRNRYNELDDMVSTIGTGFLGLTIGCARCHDHKFDAIAARDYYSLMAAVHSGDRSEVELGKRSEIEERARKKETWSRELRGAEERLASWLAGRRTELEPGLRAAKIDSLPVGAEVKSALRGSTDPRAGDTVRKTHEAALRVSDDDLRRAMSPEERLRWTQLAADVKASREREPRPPPRAFAFKDFQSEPRTTWLFQRGDFNDRDEPVELGFLQVLLSGKTAAEYWKEARARRPLPESTYQRRALADWITDPEHGAGALLARVIVNRVWKHHFGEGLVRTVNDFGVQGDPPSHPELLEWLAHDFVEHGWSLKRLHRLLVTSAVYQQDSAFDAERARIDPENRLLWRRRPQRLEAEALRDSMLAASGTLNPEAYGPAFKPPIAAEAQVARNLKTPYPNDIKDSPLVRRRSIYMFHKRVVPDPLMQAFDKPDAQQSCGRREITTVATQALALLNDPMVRDVASDFARRVVAEAGEDPRRWVERAYRVAFDRSPSDEELSAALELIATQTARRAKRGEDASPGDARLEAIADLCQTIFSLNEFLYFD